MSHLSFYKTRMAPTPSGYLHIGNAASFVITASLAKRAGAKLLLRIDDLDRERTRKEYVKDIFETLYFLEIEWQEGPKDLKDYEQHYSQLYRIKLYEEWLLQLREEKHVFACQCSRTQLQAGSECYCRERELSLDAPNTSWRLITDESLILPVRGWDDKYVTVTLPSAMMMFIVRKKNGMPSYQLSSLADDEYFGVDTIVRGQDLWNSTLAQQYLAQILNKSFFQDVRFYHHPLILDIGGDKLSKSAGATSIRHLISEGNTRNDVIARIKSLMPETLHIL